MSDVDLELSHTNSDTLDESGETDSLSGYRRGQFLQNLSTLNISVLMRFIRDHKRALIAFIPVTILAFLYFLRFAILSVNVLNHFGAPAFDMSVPDQGMWLLSRFHDPFVTIMGRNLFGDHSEFVLLILVPFYWIYPHGAVLLIAQALVIAAAAIPIYLLARHLLHSNIMATLLAAVYLLNPALQWGNMEQFHVESFEILFVSIAIYAAVIWRPRLLMVAIVLLLLSNQDAAMYVLPIGIWVAFRRERREGIKIVALSVIAAVLINFLIIPLLLGSFNFGATKYSGRLPFGGVIGSMKEIVRYPGQVWAYVTSQGRPWYVWQMFASAGLIFVVTPEIALIAIIALGINVWTSFGYQHEIMYHYSLPIVPVLVCGTIWALSRIPKRRAVWLTGLIVLGALWSCTIWGLAPFSDQQYPSSGLTSYQVAEVQDLINDIPSNAVVSAFYDYTTALDDRTQIYMWPNPFSTSLYGLPNQPGGVTLPVASQVQYILLPQALGTDSPQVLTQIAPQFHVLAQNETAVLYERNTTG